MDFTASTTQHHQLQSSNDILGEVFADSQAKLAANAAGLNDNMTDELGAAIKQNTSNGASQAQQ